MIDCFRGPNGFLSNFYPCTIIDDGISYYSVEHAYMAMKTLDRTIRERIAICATPGQAKRMGRKIKLRAGWENIKVDIMRGLLEKKFQDPTLRQQLLDTGDEELMEGNTWGDEYWGVCRGKGKNMLGKLLMALRETLRV